MMKKTKIHLFYLIIVFTGYNQICLSQNKQQTETTSDSLTVTKPSDNQIIAYNNYFDQNYERHIDELIDLISYPSLSMQADHQNDLIEAAEFLKNKLINIGLEKSQINFSNDLPIVTSEYNQHKDQPTVLFYGHFDVQPVNREQWQNDPFKAEIRDGRLYGRGATDDKGPIIALISTLEALMTIDGKLPVNIKILLDGGEEIVSSHLPNWLADHKDWLKDIDFGINIDAAMYSDEQGLIWKGLRGASDIEVTLTSANTDLHSGIYGGVAPNAAVAASKVIASMYNDDGSVAIEGFYDDLKIFSEFEKKEIAASVDKNQEADELRKFEIDQWIGEADYTYTERTWIRGSMDVTGFKSGYTDGKASIIPHNAWFRIMTRLGPGQNPEKINSLIKSHIERNIPWGIQAEFKASGMAAATVLNENDLGYKIGKKVLTDFFGISPKILYIGGTIPALSFIPQAGGPDLVSIGFQRSDENFHADNEFMRIDSFKKGQRIYAQLLHAFVNQNHNNPK